MSGTEGSRKATSHVRPGSLQTLLFSVNSDDLIADTQGDIAALKRGECYQNFQAS